MAKSLQQIEDYYLRQGLVGADLRKALEEDIEFQELLKERKSKVQNRYGITPEEEKEYLLPNDEDYQILFTIKMLESKNLEDQDKEIIDMMKTQLREDWRTSLLERLKQLTEKYS